MQKILIDDIKTDCGTQPRAQTDELTVSDYTEALGDGIEFPPVVVFSDGVTKWLADGFHRLLAHKRAGKVSIAAEVRQGTLRDAILYSVGANISHGLRRTNADKQKAVDTLLNDGEWSKWSNVAIAKACGVHQSTVADRRKSLSVSESETPSARKSLSETESETPPVERTYTTKHGTQATMNTAKIGKKAEPEAAWPESFGPSDEELDEAKADEEAERKAIELLLASDDKLSAAFKEIKRLNALVAGLEARIVGLQNERNEAVRQAQRYKKKLEKLEKAAA